MLKDAYSHHPASVTGQWFAFNTAVRIGWRPYKTGLSTAWPCNQMKGKHILQLWNNIQTSTRPVQQARPLLETQRTHKSPYTHAGTCKIMYSKHTGRLIVVIWSNSIVSGPPDAISHSDRYPRDEIYSVVRGHRHPPSQAGGSASAVTTLDVGCADCLLQSLHRKQKLAFAASFLQHVPPSYGTQVTLVACRDLTIFTIGLIQLEAGSRKI